MIFRLTDYFGNSVCIMPSGLATSCRMLAVKQRAERAATGSKEDGHFCFPWDGWARGPDWRPEIISATRKWPRTQPLCLSTSFYIYITSTSERSYNQAYYQTHRLRPQQLSSVEEFVLIMVRLWATQTPKVQAAPRTHIYSQSNSQ